MLHPVSVPTVQLCPCVVKAATDYVNEWVGLCFNKTLLMDTKF